MLDVDAVYCISLHSRSDRRAELFKSFEVCGLSHRIQFILRDHLGDRLGLQKGHPMRTKAGDLGCATSHRFAIDQAKRLGYERILVLEDDCEPSTHFSYDEMNVAIGQAEEFEQDIVNLGGISPSWRPGTPKLLGSRITPSLYSVRNMVTTHAIVYLKESFERVALNIPTFEEILKTFSNVLMLGAYDQWLHDSPHCATTAYPMIYQRNSGASDIVGVPHNFDFKQLTNETYELLRAAP